MNQTTQNAQEIENFNALAAEWWDENGPMKPLHRLNPKRIEYITGIIKTHLGQNIDKTKILDVGCGGGIVCEPLARLGADVTGIDAAPDSIKVAKAHAGARDMKINYKNTDVENQAKLKTKYDVVMALEIVEHVDNLPLFLKSCQQCLKPDGILIVSTLNRNPKSFLLGIVAAEYILKWVPKGTHNWRKFVKPSELAKMIEPTGLTPKDVTGLVYNPLNKEFSLSKKDLDVNYFMTFAS